MGKPKAAVPKVALALLAILPLASFADGLTSGPPVGGRTRPFKVQDVTGPAKGTELCYI